jgi:hypothetical protein
MTIRQKVTVQPGGTIELHDLDLPTGVVADVVVTVNQVEKGPARYPAFDPTARPFWEEVLEIGASVPMAEWEKVPRDLSKNLDHYLYGHSKAEEE